MHLTGSLILREEEIVDIDKLRDLLTITNPEYLQQSRYRKFSPVGIEKEICYLREIEKGVYSVPRNIPEGYYRGNKSEAENLTVTGEKIKSDFTFKGIPRDYQKKYLGYFMPEDFVMEVYAGGGKTFLAIKKISEYKVKTIILAPTLLLVDQFVGAINQFLPGASVGVISLEKTDKSWEEKDIIVTNLDRLNAREDILGVKFFQMFGLIIFDEAHHLGAYTYFPLIEKFPAKYRIALTATFRRNDEVFNILKYQFGTVVRMDSTFDKAEIVPLYTGIKFEEKDYCIKTGYESIHSVVGITQGFYVLRTNEGKRLDVSIYKVSEGWAYQNLETGEVRPFIFSKYRTVTRYRWELNIAKYNNLLSTHGSRNKFLFTIMLRLVSKGRTVLVVARTRDILEKLHAESLKRGLRSVIVVGKTGKKFTYTLEDIKNADVIFGINKLVSEGMDAPRVDTAILWHPQKDIEQVKGRTERLLEGKQKPLLIFPIDDTSFGRGIFVASQQYLKGSRILAKVTCRDYLKLV